MTLVSEIIKDAFREANIIPISQSPTLDEQVEGLRLLGRFVDSVIGHEAGDRLSYYELNDSAIVSVTGGNREEKDDDVVPIDSHLAVVLTSPRTILLPSKPYDGARFAVVDVLGTFSTTPLTLLGNGRKIDGGNSLVLNTDGSSGEWFYRADIGSWNKLTALELSSTLPFPSKFDDLFILGLALRLNPRNSVRMDEQSIAAYKDHRRKFRAQYTTRREVRPELAFINLTGVLRNRLTSDALE